MADDETLKEFEDRLLSACRAASVSFEEAGRAADKLAEALAKVPDEVMIACIRSNPSLSCFQKWRLCRKLGKSGREKRR